MINAHHLLAVGDDAGLGGGRPALLDEQPLHGDALRHQAGPQAFAGIVVSHDAGEMDLGLEPGHIGGRVRRPAGNITAFVEFHDRDGGFRGDTLNGAPQILVEHHVAGDQHAPARKACQDAMQEGVHPQVLREDHPDQGSGTSSRCRCSRQPGKRLFRAGLASVC